MQKGLLIAFEGIDGVGKSTQIQLLGQELQAQGKKVLLTREPSDSTYGQQIRQIYSQRENYTPEEELDLFLQDRRIHVKDVIRPALEKGYIVLTDRYYYSNIAYQGAAGLDTEVIAGLNAFAPVPDLVFILTLPPELAIERIIKNRGEQPNAFERLDNLRKVAHVFANLQDTRIHRINAVQSEAAVQRQIQGILSEIVRLQPHPCTSERDKATIPFKDITDDLEKGFIKIYATSIVGEFCIAVQDGEKIFDTLNSHLSKGTEKVIVSFKDAGCLSGAFVGAAIGRLYGKYRADYISTMLTIECEEKDRPIFLYKMRDSQRYYENPELYERIYRETIGDEEENWEDQD